MDKGDITEHDLGLSCILDIFFGQDLLNGSFFFINAFNRYCLSFEHAVPFVLVHVVLPGALFCLFEKYA